MKQGWKKVITMMLAFALAISVVPVNLSWANTAQAESADTTAAAAYGYVTADGVKVRRQASTSSVYWFKVDTGFVVEILGVEEKGGITWYNVNSTHPNNNGRTYIGFIHGDFFKVMSAEEVEQWKSANGTVSGGTGSTGSAPVATAAPSVVNGYVQLILTSANLRNEPAGDVVMQWETKGEILPYFGSPITKGKFTWYNVEYRGLKYYVRNDTVQTVTAEGLPVTAAPAATPAPDSVTGYVITTKGGVNLRLKPAGETITQVNKNVVVPCVGSMVTSGGYDWYNVNYNGMRGYLRGDCVKVCNADGSTSGVTQAPSAGGSTTETVIYGYVKMTAHGVNLRTSPAGRSQEQLDKDVVVPVIGTAVTSGKYTWYPVKAASGTTGYVRGDCAAICNADGTTEGATLGGGSVTSAPSTGGTTTSSYGYIQLTKHNVNLRDAIGGKTLTQLDKDTVWPMIASMQTVNNVTWYPVKVNNYTGYVRGDCAFKLSATQEESYLAGNGVPEEAVTPAPAVSTYLKTVVAAVNLRASASKDAKAEFNVPLGTVMAYNDTTTSGGSTWYRVVYQNKEVWVLGSCVAIMSAEEYAAYIAANPNNTPQPEVAVGYLKTTLSDVNIRATAGGSNILTRVNKDVVMPFLSTPTSARNYTWYLVKAPDGQRGYIRNDCIVICNADGSEIIGGSTGGNTGTGSGSSTGQEATYITLRLGSTGAEVEKLVTELRSQGYYSGDVVSIYNSDVQAAVLAYQKDKGLSADGIAGPVTQHSLFGTIPAGSGTGDLTITLYPAEKIDWFTGGIQQLMPKGSNFKVYDVKTGIVWWAHRWSGFNHADIETLTAADTARLCKIYGVSDASQITNKGGHWVRRPCLVTIGERTFACSLYGVPHNPKGDTIDDNNMTGQICLHFTNSRTSDTDILDEDHQKAIDYAWQNAPNGHK